MDFTPPLLHSSRKELLYKQVYENTFLNNSMQGHTISPSDPDNLEDALKSSPKDFFWDSVTKYVAGIILGLAGLNFLLEFFQGNKISCLTPNVTGDFFSVYCASHVPKAEHFPAFMSLHAILILVPHALWANVYSGSFEFFFTQARMIDRTRDFNTGYYYYKNYAIAKQLRKVFTAYDQKRMFWTYIGTLVLQLTITLMGFFVVIFYFKKFKEVFLCPTNSFESLNDFWPITEQITCVSNSIGFFAIARMADLILLGILILSYLSSLAWCIGSHPSAIGIDTVAEFSFQSSIGERHYMFDSKRLRKLHGYFGNFLHAVSLCIPFCGCGPRISSNLDFLMVKLYRTDSGLGFVLRNMQILSKLSDYNHNDLRVAKLYKNQQETKELKAGGKSNKYIFVQIKYTKSSICY